MELRERVHVAAIKAPYQGKPLWVHFADAFNSPEKAGAACMAYLDAAISAVRAHDLEHAPETARHCKAAIAALRHSCQADGVIERSTAMWACDAAEALLRECAELLPEPGQSDVARAREIATLFFSAVDEPDHFTLADTIAVALARVRAEEREACAKVAECNCADVCGEQPGRPRCDNEIAAAIRGTEGA